MVCGDGEALDATGIWGPHRLSPGTALDTRKKTLGRGPDLGIFWKEVEVK